MQQAVPPLILASGSAGRAALLRAAGVLFSVETASLDEAAIKRAARAEREEPSHTAQHLAQMKAQRVSMRHPGALVIGADQILLCDGRCYDKPQDLGEARAHLQALRGRTHHLLSAAVCLQDGRTLWQHLAKPALAMRQFSDAWIEGYLACAGDSILASVGGYRIEELGLQCFQSIEGEHGAIVGLPMLPLLGFLRQYGVLTA
jgi:septum formation protein